MDLNLAKVPFGKWMNKRAKRSSIASRQRWKLKNCFRAHFWSINCEYEVINSCETHCDTATVSTASNKFPIFQIRDVYLPFHWPFVIINNAKTQPKAVNCKVRKDQKKISPELRLRSVRGSVPCVGLSRSWRWRAVHTPAAYHHTLFIFSSQRYRFTTVVQTLFCIVLWRWTGRARVVYAFSISK